jgi:hypothetical protein
MLKYIVSLFRKLRGLPSPSDEEITAAIKKVLSRIQPEAKKPSPSSKVCLVTFNDGRQDVCSPEIHDQEGCDIFRAEIGGSGCSIQDGPCSSRSRIGYSQ